MYRVRHQHVKFWLRDVARSWEIDMPESLFDKPLACLVVSSGTLSASASFLMAESPFQ